MDESVVRKPEPTQKHCNCGEADKLSKALELHRDATEAVLSHDGSSNFYQLRHSTSRATDLQKQLAIKVPESDDMLTASARLIVDDLVSRLPLQRADWPLPETTQSLAFANKPQWLSALVTGSPECTDLALAAATSAISTSSDQETADAIDIEELISAATVVSSTNQQKNCDRLPRLLIVELMRRPGLLILRRIDRLFVICDPGVRSRIFSAMLTELLVRVHALRCRSTRGCVKNAGVQLGRSRLLATAASADEIPASAKRRLFDLIV